MYPTLLFVLAESTSFPAASTLLIVFGDQIVSFKITSYCSFLIRPSQLMNSLIPQRQNLRLDVGNFLIDIQLASAAIQRLASNL